jgi:hypothetical protein
MADLCGSLRPEDGRRTFAERDWPQDGRVGYFGKFRRDSRRLRFPLCHRRAIRTTNLLERLFGTKVIPHAFVERAILKLMYGALIRAAERWHGIRISEFERRQLKAIRDEIDSEFAKRNAPATTPTVTASPTRLSSKDRT